ncbi:hypothetical protein PVAP13_9NG388900 [Panicum virgatum]|uniref:Uncharacterized protein n=1 Tax=Panicum virgatum TaxID=38727 RepID=A0A8T0MLC2_PANVG|nr:hypothetical protein PVAP13_9NG388900 [Panicum virgatum]
MALLLKTKLLLQFRVFGRWIWEVSDNTMDS